jgi:Protein of unknown function (DUF2934)
MDRKQQIRERAYEIYLSRGGQNGDELSDWLAAERELQESVVSKMMRADEFISEDDLKSFEGWLRYQGIDAPTTSPEDLQAWRTMFDEVRAASDTAPKVGLMKLRTRPGEHRYAVALRDGSDLWIALWIRRSPKGEFFVFLPRSDPSRDVHVSYHLDGTMHIKSFGHKTRGRKLQRPTANFRGTESLGTFAGYGPKGVGAICDPGAFAGIVEVGPGILGPKDGVVQVDLIEPGCKPMTFYGKLFRQQTFSDTVPSIVVTVGSASEA